MDNITLYSLFRKDNASGGSTNIGDNSITNVKYLCHRGNRVNELNRINTSAVKSFEQMFTECSSITSVPYFDTSSGVVFHSMFSDCQSLTSIPHLNTSNGTNFAYMFFNCKSLKTIPHIDTSNGTNFGYMFNNCQSLISVPDLDTSNGTIFYNMFTDCKLLTVAPNLDTSKGTSFNSMFQNCQSLTTVPHLDLLSASSVTNPFINCVVLTDLYLYNVKKAITIGSGTAYGHLITIESLVHIFNELVPTDANLTLTMGDVNIDKINDLYCKVLDTTQEKLPMELCESNDEGAILVTDYIMAKGWNYQ